MAEWLIENYIEVLGALLSMLYLYLSIRQNIWLWPVGILSAIMYVIVFFQAKFYADMGLNGYYFLISIYGWIIWTKGRNKENGSMPVIRTTVRQGVLFLLVIAALFVGIGLLLDHFTDSPIPYWDAFTTAGSIVATWMLAKKYLEHWIIWIVVDLVSMGLYIERGLYPTMILFAVYTAMAIVGFLQWKKTLKTREA
jgi:nicotinamide mononucleotide transporter